MAINRNKVIAVAQKYAEKGAYDKAIAEFLKVVKEEPDDVRTWLKVGDLYAKKGARQEATSTYLKVAEYYANQGFYLKAVAVYKQILKLDPTVVQVNIRLAELYQQLGLLSDAQNQYEHVAGFFQRQGRTRDALDVMQKLVELDPDNVPSRIKLAELYSKEEMREDAVREFGVAADRLREQGRIDDFIKVGERLLWHKPGAIDLGRELAAIYLERGDPKRALAKLQQCFQAAPRDVETLQLLARAFQTIGQLPKTISVYKEMARIFAEGGDEGRRREVLQAILAIAPDDPDANHELYGAGAAAPAPPAYQAGPVGGGVTFEAPEYGASEGFEGALAVEMTPQPRHYPSSGGLPSPYAPTPAPPYQESQSFEVDDALVEEVQELDAVEDAEELVVVDGPQDRGSEISRLLTETDVFVKYGLHDKAIEHLQKVFEIDPVHVEAREKLKDIYLQLGETGRALAELYYLSDLYGTANPQGAIYYLQEALAVAPGHPETVARLAAYGVQEPVGQGAAAGAGYEEELGAYAEPSDLLLGADDLDVASLSGGAGAGPRLPPLDAVPVEESTIETAAEEAGDGGAAAMSTRVEEELEEVDFFLQQGLLDEARSLLDELARSYPGNRIIQDKLAELDSVARGAEPLLDQSFDLGSQIPESIGAPGASALSEGDDVKDAFEQFKQGVAQQVDAGDADTHFELGVAYREMGLVDDAIAEFELARENPEREALAQTMIGHCHLQAGQTTEAINAFKRGLYAERKSTNEELSLYYELGSAYMSLSDPKEALYYFQKVAKRDPSFRDVGHRIAVIESAGAHADGKR